MTDFEDVLDEIESYFSSSHTNNRWYSEPCNNSGHQFPSMLFIPPGQRVEHICPGCGAKSYAYGPSVTM